jgi:hypothetical protein
VTSKIWASIEAIQAISHQFVQCQTAIRWLEWLHRKLSIVSGHAFQNSSHLKLNASLLCQVMLFEMAAI